jgi:hypothetical protein
MSVQKESDQREEGLVPTDANAVASISIDKGGSASRLDDFSNLFDSAEERRRRATHRIEIESDAQYTWTTILEIDLSPDTIWGADSLVVPMLRVPTGFVPHLHLTDEGGVQVPTLTPDEADELVLQYVKLTWTIHFDDISPNDGQVEDITRAVKGDASQRAEALDRLCGAIRSSETNGDAGGNSYLEDLIRTCGETSLVCARVPLHAPGRVASHRVFTLSYSYNKNGGLGSAVIDPAVFRRAERRRTARAILLACFRWVGAAPEVLAIPVNDAFLDHSVHYEVQAPPGLLFVRGTLVDGDNWEPLTAKEHDVRPGDRIARVHAPPGLVPCSGNEQAALQIQLYPDSNGLHRRARSTTWWIAISTAVVIFFLPIIQAHGHSSEMAAGFVAAAGGSSAIMLYGIDNRVAWRMLRMARWMLVVSAMSVVITAALLIGVEPIEQNSQTANYCSADGEGVFDCVRRIAFAEPSIGLSSIGLLGKHRWWIFLGALAPAILLSTNTFYWWRARRRWESRSRLGILLGSCSDLLHRRRSRISEGDRVADPN